MEAAKDVMQRVGSKGTVGATVAALCRRLTPSLLAPEHVAELLSRAQTVGFLVIYAQMADMAFPRMPAN